MKTPEMKIIATRQTKMATAPSPQGESMGVQLSNENFIVKLTDSPGDYAGLKVHITGVEVYAENKGWLELNNEVDFVNVLELTNGKEIRIANDTNEGLQKGNYSMLKVKFGDDNFLTVKTKSTPDNKNGYAEVKLQYQGEKEIILDLGVVNNGVMKTEVLLDFDVAKSVIFNGKDYILAPALKVLSDQKTGVKGRVTGTVRAAVMVTDGKDTISTFTDPNGNFLIRGLDEGKYTLIVLPESDPKTNSIITQRKTENVYVAHGLISEVNTIWF